MLASEETLLPVTSTNIRKPSRRKGGLMPSFRRRTSSSKDASAPSNWYPSDSMCLRCSRTFRPDSFSVSIPNSLILASIDAVPESSDISTRRWLPTRRGSMCSYVFSSFISAFTCTPALWAKALLPTYGSLGSMTTLAVSLIKLESEVRAVRSGTDISRPILSASVGMMEQRLALPHLSPSPLMVPCTMVAPPSTAARELATARSASLCAWIPSGRSNRLATTSMAVLTSPGSVPPLVSHRTSQSAPAWVAASRLSNAYSGEAL